jgi:TetR/AcrR family transcriptional repressor of mexJK operon
MPRLAKTRSASQTTTKRRSNGGRPTQAQIALRDKRLLDTAEALFIAHGFSATTLENIAKQSRVALRTIYQQHGGKEEIFAAMIRRYVTHISDLDLDLDWNGALDAVLRRAAVKLVEFCTIPEAVAFQRLMIAESARFPALMLALSQEAHGKTMAAVEAVLVEARKRGLIETGDIKLAARLFIEMTVGWSLMFSAMGNNTITPGKKELGERVERFIRAYGTRISRA